jgi:hypothetical protein
VERCQVADPADAELSAERVGGVRHDADADADTENEPASRTRRTQRDRQRSERARQQSRVEALTGEAADRHRVQLGAGPNGQHHEEHHPRDQHRAGGQ